MTFWVAGAVVLSSAIGSGASRSAAKTQAEAARQSGETQREIFERQVELQEPFRQSGLAAQNRLLTLLGIGPQTAPGGLDGAGGSLIGTPIGAAGDPTSPEFGKYAKEFGMQQFQADPGYGFRMAEGMKALERSAAARGGLLSGGALKATQRFGQDLASQEYQNAFNRYQAERQARLNPLQSLAGLSQTSANVLTGEAGRLGQSLGEAQQSAAAARASGYVGSANAFNQGLSTYLNYSQGQNYLNALRSSPMAYTTQPGFSNTPSYLVTG